MGTVFATALQQAQHLSEKRKTPEKAETAPTFTAPTMVFNSIKTTTAGSKSDVETMKLPTVPYCWWN